MKIKMQHASSDADMWLRIAHRSQGSLKIIASITQVKKNYFGSILKMRFKPRNRNLCHTGSSVPERVNNRHHKSHSTLHECGKAAAIVLERERAQLYDPRYPFGNGYHMCPQRYTVSIYTIWTKVCN